MVLVLKLLWGCFDDANGVVLLALFGWVGMLELAGSFICPGFWSFRSCSSFEGIQGLLARFRAFGCSYLFWLLSVLGFVRVGFGFVEVIFGSFGFFYIIKMDFWNFPVLPYRWLAPSSVMVYWAIAESYLRARWLC